MNSGTFRVAAVALLAVGMTACAAVPEPALRLDQPSQPKAAETETVPSGAAPGIAVFDPATVIQDDWFHLALNGATEYRVAYLDGRLAIRAEPRKGATGLIRRVTIDPSRCPLLEWSWRVEQVQASADLRVKEGDDVAASIFLLFGDPGFISDPDPVPTLRYVWTNGNLAQDAVIDSPYMPGTVLNVVVQNGGAPLGARVTERRDIAADFWRAFGRAPAAPVSAVAILTDNDQTGEPALAHYGAARAHCRW